MVSYYSLTPTGGSGGNLTCFLDSPDMVSYYLPIHFMALNTILNKIIGGNNSGGGEETDAKKISALSGTLN